MENPETKQRLLQGAAALNIPLSESSAGQLCVLTTELLRWNVKVNLTAVTDPDEVLEKHLLDSLAVAPEVKEGRRLLDVGTGGGFPGIPLKVLFPELDVVLVEAIGKKVGFLKHAIARLGLQGARALQARLTGKPEQEGLGQFDRVISRALTDVRGWLPLAAPYLAPGGRVIAMLGQPAGAEELEEGLQGSGLRLLSSRSYALPFSGAPRSVMTFGV